MTDREIKKMLKAAYASPENEKEKVFIRRYEKRSLHLMSIIKIEARYMGIQSVYAGLVLCMLLFVLARNQDADMVWTVSSLIPVGSLIPMILLSGSERFGMAELEAVSRFSLRYIRTIRMFMMGIFSMVLLAAVSIILLAATVGNTVDCLVFVAVPYLISTYGAMIVTRKWHSRDNIFGVLAVCLFSGLIPFAVKAVRLSGQLSDKVIIFLAAVLLAAVIRECRLYVKESEDLSWNLC